MPHVTPAMLREEARVEAQAELKDIERVSLWLARKARRARLAIRDGNPDVQA
jgi:hypothetical protein